MGVEPPRGVEEAEGGVARVEEEEWRGSDLILGDEWVAAGLWRCLEDEAL